MFAKSQSISIASAPEAVYDYLADLQRHGEWSAQPLEVRPETGTPGEPGTTYTSTARTMGGVTAAIRVVAAERPTRFAYECEDMSGRYRWTFRVQPDGSGTMLTYGFERLSAPPWVKAIQPWLLWPLAGKPGFEKSLQAIKPHLEPLVQTKLA